MQQGFSCLAGEHVSILAHSGQTFRVCKACLIVLMLDFPLSYDLMKLWWKVCPVIAKEVMCVNMLLCW